MNDNECWEARENKVAKFKLKLKGEKGGRGGRERWRREKEGEEEMEDGGREEGVGEVVGIGGRRMCAAGGRVGIDGVGGMGWDETFTKDRKSVV